MDPASSSSPLSSLTHPQPHSSSSSSCSSAAISDVTLFQKPAPSLPYELSTYSAQGSSQFSQPPGMNYLAFSDTYNSAAGDPIDQGFAGGDQPLLTSSWEALDRLAASASMMPCSGSVGQMDHLAEYQGLSCVSQQGAMATLQNTVPANSLPEVDQKPLIELYGSFHRNNGCTMMSNQNHSICSTNISPVAGSNVGISLASLISADPGFVERAAKFSSYSQQINSQGYVSSGLSHMSKSTHNNPMDKAAISLSEMAASAMKKYPYNHGNDVDHTNKILSRNVPQRTRDSAKSDPTLIDNYSSINESETHSGSPQPSLSGAKTRKRQGSNKECAKEDSGDNPSSKKAKIEDPHAGDKTNNSCKAGIKASKPKAAGTDKNVQNMDRTNSGESEQKSEVSNTNKTPSPSPPPKPDYIHVRARRGQATDSHSLAERVRREKIGQRMKYLQDLVPGCTKVTGKAMMLDEIINYVQSLQRQVEFLSMKLASVPPSKLDFNFESLFGKEMTRSQPPLQHGCDSPSLVGPPLQSRQPLNPSPFFQQVAQVHQQHLPIYGESTCTPLTSAMLQNSLVSDSFPRRTFNMLALVPSSENFGECIPQIQDAWVDDDLVPLAGYAQTLNMHSSLQGASSHGQMKTEL